MSIMLALLFVIFLASTANAAAANLSNLIIGGYDASISYVVSLEFNGDPICGGSIITSQHVLTAAQCESPIGPLLIRAGSNIRGFGGSIHQIAQFIRHEGYAIRSSGIPINDIAVVKVHQPFYLDRSRSIINRFEFWQKLSPTAWGIVSGFGITSDGGTAKWLQAAVVPVVPRATCSLIYLSSGGLPEGQLCASNLRSFGKDICAGDAGGGLEVNGRLVGIISWSAGCAKKYFPSVYTDVGYYQLWIDAKIR